VTSKTREPERRVGPG